MKNKIENIFNKKKEIVHKLNKLFTKIKSFILIDPTNIKSNELNNFRKISKRENINLFIVKNSLLNRSLIKTKFEIIINKFKGPTLVAYSDHDVIFLLKKIKNFIDNINFGKIKLIFDKSDMFLEDKVDYLCLLPLYIESIKKFIYILSEISIKRFIRSLFLIKNKKGG